MNSLNSNYILNSNTLNKYSRFKSSPSTYKNTDNFKKFNDTNNNIIYDNDNSIIIKKTYLTLISIVALIILKKSIYD